MLRKRIFEKDDKTSEENLTPDDNEQTLSPDDKLKAIILLLMLVSSTETEEERTGKEKFATAKAICYDRDEEELTENVLWKANSSGYDSYFTDVKCMLMNQQSKFNKEAYFKELKKIISTKYNVDIKNGYYCVY
ncbi:hypothetical protein TVAG_372790 [Trichomonas vaginalis G3]|uniref:Uncharacterized protein n=1 Tax=Trichomonas vaginalis (strain ATCC PRA-98 / G3) TaxID=412133 RepID=A2GD28_TRIV3|nr:hypothetical protein TVAGG3_0659120 [Trichomonas vaginalis G3]EAX84939.1 hypothetical protein TVAG_372790 [Trichomonas vaginalis G3]KAI5506375.1 hypothetical protein TVAGG3_0659120 [Trichomonas vaginalis G3]|eukprot:XP_001297869.1 hypothetical protein [Trichomonas vaginalis G3]